MPVHWASGATSSPTTTRRWTTRPVEVPAWRHALINYPHPLLKRGLVVLDTPGLNAIGAEPELTLSPAAQRARHGVHPGADTGVTEVRPGDLARSPQRRLAVALRGAEQDRRWSTRWPRPSRCVN
jgi:hypothetical protein